MSDIPRDLAAKLAVHRFRAGASLAQVVDTGFAVSVEVAPGVQVEARPFFGEDGRVHLQGRGVHQGREVEFSVSAKPEDAESLIREAISKNIPLRVYAWLQSTFGRDPIVRRSFGFESAPPRALKE